MGKKKDREQKEDDDDKFRKKSCETIQEEGRGASRQEGDGEIRVGKGPAGRRRGRPRKDNKWVPGVPGGVVVPGGVIMPGGKLDHLQTLVGYPREDEERVVQGKSSARKDWEKAWRSELARLIDSGKTLDQPTDNPHFWRAVAGSAGQFKMPKGDVWVEQHLKIRTKLGNVKLMQLNPAQLRYSHDCAATKAKRNIVLKARQVGITSYVAARYFVQTIMRPGTLTMLVAHDREAAEEIFRIVHRFWDNPSEESQKGPLKTSHSSARELVFPRLDSEFTVASADENAGRGRTIQNLHCTEVSRWGRDGEEALASLRAAVVPGGEIVLESTANGAWGSFYQEWQQAEETGYTRHFFPWWFEESYKSETGPLFEVTEEEAGLAKANGLTLGQIAWRRRQRAALRGLAGQEFAEDAVTCFRTSGECVFELDVIDNALATAPEPLKTRYNGELSMWLPPQPGKRYVIGVDPAGGGVEGDYSCGQVIERTSGTQCAELHGHFSLKELCNKLVELAKDYNSAMLAVERNNHGAALLVHLRHTTYQEIYERDGDDGWLTSKASRPVMIESLAEVMAESPELFRSAKLWNECRTFVRTVNGTTGAAPGAFDDCVMAMGIALAVRDEQAAKGWKGVREAR